MVSVFTGKISRMICLCFITGPRFPETVDPLRPAHSIKANFLQIRNKEHIHPLLSDSHACRSSKIYFHCNSRHPGTSPQHLNKHPQTERDLAWLPAHSEGCSECLNTLSTFQKNHTGAFQPWWGEARSGGVHIPALLLLSPTLLFTRSQFPPP